jgi:hypothetical protein
MLSKTLDSNFYSNLICIHQQLEHFYTIFQYISIDTNVLSDLFPKSKPKMVRFFFNLLTIL